MKIYLLLNQSYPYGYALTKRFHFYAKGFILNKHQAKIVIPLPTEKEESDNKDTAGVFDGVPFKYTWSSTNRSKHFLMRRIHDMLGGFQVIQLLVKEKPDVVITAAFSVHFFFLLRIAAILGSFKMIREKNEIDFLRKDVVSKSDLKKVKFQNSFFDGFIVINELLCSYMNKELQDSRPKVVVPILVDDFKRNKTLSVQKTIVYTGTYLERKDGICTILKAFSKIIKNYPDYRLVLTGSPNKSEDLPEIKRLIEAYKLDSNIVFTGYLMEAELHDILMTAGMLVLAKPQNRQNSYNFPTKIGEYLISGRPVISTRVGIVGEILVDGQNILFSEYDVDDLVRKMEFLIINPEIAKNIGDKGRKYALKNFSYKLHAQRMLDFFKELGHF